MHLASPQFVDTTTPQRDAGQLVGQGAFVAAAAR
jgi:hypothetical protein